jgi:hypothetical protein
LSPRAFTSAKTVVTTLETSPETTAFWQKDLSALINFGESENSSCCIINLRRTFHAFGGKSARLFLWLALRDLKNPFLEGLIGKDFGQHNRMKHFILLIIFHLYREFYAVDDLLANTDAL